MLIKQHKKELYLYGILMSLLVLMSACTARISHIPGKALDDIHIAHPASIMVADIGDERIDEPIDRIGQGASYWLPISYYARDDKGGRLPVSYYIASSLKQDLEKIGYQAKISNDAVRRKPISFEEAMNAAKRESADYLVTTKVLEGKTNYWGFIIIPFVQPVWTRISYDVQLIDMRQDVTPVPLQGNNRDTEWYFGKITIFDAVYDAGVMGRHWHQTAWGKTVVSQTLADTALKISAEIQAKKKGSAVSSETLKPAGGSI
jgi:hypothetical protein